MSLTGLAAGVALVCAVGCPVDVLAAPPDTSANRTQLLSSLPPSTAQQSALIDGFGRAVSAGTLGRYSGGSGLVQNNNNLTGTVANDSATDVTSGANSITGDSFAGASGLPSVIQNSGNNVLIQNAVIVNVQMKP